MKTSFLNRATLFLTGLFLASTLSLQAVEKITSLTLEGDELKDIKRVTLKPDGKVTIIYGASGGQYPAEKLPKDFLASWGITAESVGEAKAKDFENAVNQGKFRLVDGVVYDLRQKQPSWTYFQNVKLVQRLRSGAALIDPYPEQLIPAAIHVLHLPDTYSDTDRFNLAGKQVGTYKYENRNGSMRVVTSYDVGLVCTRSEIPDAIIKDGKPFADLPQGSNTQRDLSADLPQSDDLTCNGTGFLITADGYLITNDHVVRGVRRVKVRLNAKVYDAKVVKADQEADLALLKIEAEAAATVPLVLDREATLGDEVFTIGFPNVDLQGIEPKFTDGKISSLTGLHDDPSRYQVSVAVQPGNSGGALFNKNGQVVGVVVSRINDFAVLKSSGSLPQNINYAIKSSALREFLKPIRELSGKLKPAGGTAEPAAAIPAAQSATVLVLGYK